MFNTKKSLIGLVSSIAIVLTFVSAQAQTPSAAEVKTTAVVPVTTSIETKPSTVIVLADINLGDVKVVQKNGTLTGTFTLFAKMGQQNDIVYGVVVYDDKGNLVTAQRLGEEATLRQGELKQYNFTYTIPTTLPSASGTVMLRTETKNGLGLGVQTLANKPLTSSSLSTLSCAVDTTEKTTCVSTVDAKISIDYVKGSMFNKSVSSERKTVTKGTPFALVPTLPAGPYYAFVSNTSTKETVVSSLSIAGNFATITNLNVTDRRNGTLSAVVVVNSSMVSGAKVKITLRDGNTSCGQAETTLKNSIAKFDVTSACKKGTAEVTLVDEKGVTLDTQNTTFSTEIVATVYPKIDTKKSTTSPLAKQVGVVIVVVGLLSALFFMYRKNKSLLIVLLVLGFAFSQAPKSFALSWGLASATNPPDYCGGTMTIDKASYKPGETVTFSTEGTCNDYAPLNVDISELFTTSVVFTHIGKGQVGNPNIVPLSVPIGANLGTNYFTMNISVFDGMGAETSDVFDVPYEVTGCDAGWGDEELAFDGWAGSGPGWCAGTSYGACDAATVTGSHEPSAKGSITFCCRGSGQYGWTRTCGYSPPTPTVNLCFGAACP